jgi:hypothetical protein
VAQVELELQTPAAAVVVVQEQAAQAVQVVRVL